MATNFTDKNISSIDITGTKYNVKSTPFHATEAEWAGGELLRYKPKKGEIDNVKATKQEQEVNL